MQLGCYSESIWKYVSECVCVCIYMVLLFRLRPMPFQDDLIKGMLLN